MGSLFLELPALLRMAVNELGSSGVLVAPSRATMKNGGRRPEFFMVARHGVRMNFSCRASKMSDNIPPSSICKSIAEIRHWHEIGICIFPFSELKKYVRRIEKITKPLHRILQLYYRTSSMPFMEQPSLPHASRSMENYGLRPPFSISARDGATNTPLLLYNYPFVIFI